jgi:hypothetical protein
MSIGFRTIRKRKAKTGESMRKKGEEKKERFSK